GSTDVGLSSGWLDLSSYQHPVLRSVYAAVLKRSDKSPVEPESDEEKTDEEKKADDKKPASTDSKKEDEKKEDAVKVEIHLEGIRQRMVALPIKPAIYVSVDAGKAGELFLTEIPD